ncbi:MAG: 3-deoxy-D-manno-octulosonic acid transferase, partial [Deltaproteobacteria bacterium]|nr:3-deoxy-D-manno-octulosonic acid transferase [Deltaproteobacteria bacterium]
MLMLVYNILLLGALCVAVPYYGMKYFIARKYRKSLGQRLGRLPHNLEESVGRGQAPRVWLHAVSVGEVTALAPIVSALRLRDPSLSIIVSTGTETGQEMARQIISAATFIYFPIDLPCLVGKAIDRMAPDLFVTVETELWPNFLRACEKRRIPAVMVNGRLSPRSFRRYDRTRFFWKEVLSKVRFIGAISDIDAKRFLALGADPASLAVMGNAKYDSLAAAAAEEVRRSMRNLLSVPPGTQVFVAGSTHAGEESAVLSVYRRLRKEYPDCLLVLAPRHPDRAGEVRTLIEQENHGDVIALSELMAGRRREERPIVLVDFIGRLHGLYSLATVVFCGGSLVKRGGQNILEPASWGTIVLYGPFMD